MSRYTGYNQRGFANSAVAITRAAVGTTTPINQANTAGAIGGNEIYGAFDTTTTVLNSSTYVSGNTAINTTTKKFGSGSLSIGGSGSNYLRLTNVLTSSGDYTVEFFFKTNNVTTHNQCIMDLNQSNSTHGGNSPYGFLQFWIQSGSFIKSVQSTNGSSWVDSSGRSSGTISADTWYHIAAQRSGSYTYYYLDGVPFSGGYLNTGTTTYTGSGLTYLGRRGRGSPEYYPNGDNTFIDDFLVTPGKAKYTLGGFTPPTRAAGSKLDAVSLYLPFDSDVNDDSSHSHTVTAYGSAAISSTQAKFGGNSLSLNGTNQYLTVPNDNVFDFGSDDFTIEMWIYMTSNAGSSAGDRHALVARRASSSNRSFHVGIQLDGGQQKLQFSHTTSGSGGTQTNYDTDIQLNTWTHIAIVRSGSSVFAFVDGVKNGTSHSIGTNTIYAGTSDLTIGYRPESSQYFPGYIDDLRISKGIARYKKNFIPPSAAVGATLNGVNETNTTTDFTALYLPFDSDVNDDSSNPFTITASGDAAISSAQSKFGGNSLGLDGSGDYLTVGSSQSAMAFAGDFTIEFWMYFTSLGGSYVGPMGCHNSTGWLFQFASGGGRFYINGSNILNTTATTSTDQWYHVAVTRNSGTVKLFIDGIEQGSLSYTSAMPTNNDLIIGASNASGQYFPGYLDDIRILNGYAKYTADFVPPTSAVGTSVSETVNDLTVLYMPFDGTTTTVSYIPSFYAPYDSDVNDDSSYSHTSTTGGDPAISSTQSKFGGYSLHLDGNDYVSYGNHSSFDIEDEDFTIEGWAYRTSNVTYGTLVAKWDSSGNQRSYILRFNVNGHLYFYRSDNGNSYQEASGNDLPAVGLNTWAHFAFVKKGRYGYFYVNGQRSTTTMDMFQSGTSAFYTSSAPLSVGAINVYATPTGANYFAGYLDDIKVTKGFAKYGLTNFTPPSSALGSSAETADVLKGGFEDLARNHGVTKAGDAAINSSVKKFGTSSMYFDGTGDYLTVSSGDEFKDFNSTEFTIEGWFYCTNDTSNQHNVIMSTGTGADSWNITITPYQKRFQLYDGTTYSTNNTGWTVNTWHHFAVCFDGSTLRQFIDGTQIRSDSYSNLTTTFSDIDIGQLAGNSSNYFNGYLDDLRIIKGHAVYTANFTPPASAHGHSSLTVSESTSETYSDTKFLSGIWDMTDVRDKMMQSTWVSNDTRITNGAGLQVLGHRWHESTATPIAWDTTTKGSNVVISNSDMTAGISGSPGTWAGTTAISVGGHSSGKIYFEATISGTQGSGYLRLGVLQNKGSATLTEMQTDSMGTWDSNVPAYANKSENRSQYNGGQVFDGSHSPANGDVFMWAFDIDNARVYFGHNGSFDLSFDPVNGTNGYDMSALPGYSSTHPWHILFQNNSSTGTVTLRTAAEAQYMPTGYSYWGTVE